jgi:hypothetical protein
VLGGGAGVVFIAATRPAGGGTGLAPTFVFRDGFMTGVLGIARHGVGTGTVTAMYGFTGGAAPPALPAAAIATYGFAAIFFYSKKTSGKKNASTSSNATISKVKTPTNGRVDGKRVWV